MLLAAPRLDEATRDRYASDIAAAAPDVEIALALVATGTVESGWRRDVETCRMTGDDGRAISLWQLHAHWLAGHDRAEVCASNGLATMLAAGELMTLRARCGAIRCAMARYVGAPPRDPRVARRVELFGRLLSTAGPSGRVRWTTLRKLADRR